MPERSNFFRSRRGNNSEGFSRGYRIAANPAMDCVDEDCSNLRVGFVESREGNAGKDFAFLEYRIRSRFCKQISLNFREASFDDPIQLALGFDSFGR